MSKTLKEIKFGCYTYRLTDYRVESRHENGDQRIYDCGLEFRHNESHFGDFLRFIWGEYLKEKELTDMEHAMYEQTLRLEKILNELKRKYE